MISLRPFLFMPAASDPEVPVTTQRSRFLVPAVLLGMLVLSAPLLASGGSGGTGGGGTGGGGTGGGGTGGGGADKLVLRINPAIGAPGGIVDVVLRTYAPRPIKQGQVVVRIAPRPAPAAAAATFPVGPVRGGLTLKALTQPVRPLTLLSVVVFSPVGDSTSKAVLTALPDSQSIQVNFQSPSGAINSADGPLAVFRFQLDPGVAPGDVFDLSLDPLQTNLKDPAGHPITVTPRPNTLTVRAPSDPLTVQAGDAVVVPGTVTPELGVVTFEPFALSGGHITLNWDPVLADGPPTVKLDPRYGQAVYTADASQPGRLVVDFVSPDASFNTVPGTIVAISLPISSSGPAGTTSPFAFDPAETWLLDPQGARLALTLENGTITIP
jgi:hypothetical protein